MRAPRSEDPGVATPLRTVMRPRGAWLLPAALGAFSFAFAFAVLPRVLGMSDESLFIYESKMLLAGKALYRDLFEIIPPGSFYLLAAALRVFGVSVATARAFDAVVQAGIVVAVYGACRTLGVRPLLAATASLAHLAVLQPAWPYASPHWLGALLTLVATWTLLVPPRRRPGLLPGVVVGALVCVQHQKAVLVGAGVLVCLALERQPDTSWRRHLVLRLTELVAGALVCAIPTAIVVLWSSGVAPVWRALVLHPLTHYAARNRVEWGYIGALVQYASYTCPRLLAWQPALTLVIAARAVIGRLRSEPFRRADVVLMVMSLASVASILYFPDYIHLAVMGPVFLLLAAACAEAVVAHARRAGPALACVALAVVVFRMQDVTRRRRHDFPVTYDTLVGQVRVAADDPVPAFIDRVRPLVEEGSEMLVYPSDAGMYLLTGTVNPTPYLFILPVYTLPEQYAEVVATLDRRGTRNVVTALVMLDDPVRHYIDAHFRRVVSAPGGYALYQRNPPVAP